MLIDCLPFPIVVTILEISWRVGRGAKRLCPRHRDTASASKARDAVFFRDKLPYIEHRLDLAPHPSPRNGPAAVVSNGSMRQHALDLRSDSKCLAGRLLATTGFLFALRAC